MLQLRDVGNYRMRIQFECVKGKGKGKVGMDALLSSGRTWGIEIHQIVNGYMKVVEKKVEEWRVVRTV